MTNYRKNIIILFLKMKSKYSLFFGYLKNNSDLLIKIKNSMSELEDSLIVVREYFKDELDETGNPIKVKVIVCKEKVSYYTESAKKSIKKYYEANKEKIQEYNNAFTKKKCESDPEYLEKLRKQKRESYHRNKLKKQMEKEV